MLFLEFFSFHMFRVGFWDLVLNELTMLFCLFCVLWTMLFPYSNGNTQEKNTRFVGIIAFAFTGHGFFFVDSLWVCVCVISQRHILFINRCRFDLHSIHQGNWIFGIQSSNSRNLKITRTIGDVLSLVWLPNRAYSSTPLQIAWNSAK